MLSDANPGMRIQALRASESLYKAGEVSLAADLTRIATKDPDTDVVIQAMLTLNHLKVPGAPDAIASARDARKSKGAAWVAERILAPPAAPAGGRGANLPPDERASVERGATAYAESCFACHGEDGRGAPMPGGRGLRAPALAGSPRVLGHRDYVAKAILHGLSGPIDGRAYAEVMPPMRASSDRWIADVASFIRNGFGNSSSLISEADVARVRKETGTRERMWTVEELERTLPRPLIPDATWRAAASHNSGAAAGAFDYARWSTNAPQEPGMWFSIELPQPTALTELQFDSPVVGGGRSGVPPASTSPRRYRVEVSTDGNSWTEVAQGEGGARTTTIVFAPVTARLVRITQTAGAKDAPPWSMERLRLFQAAGEGGPK
jgi:mono/diheme cytochrome c family protein